MLRPVRLAEVLQARARLSTVSAPTARAQRTVRELWDAAELLLMSDVSEGSGPARLALHREALRAALSGLLPNTEGLALELWRRTPATTQALFASSLEGVAAMEQLLGDDPPLGLLTSARHAHERVLAALEADLSLVQRYARQRTAGLMVILATALVVTMGLMSLFEWARAPKDLAAGRPFTVSSVGVECHPDKGECGGYPTKIFFHTGEDKSPWYQVDLGEPAPTFSALTIRNRTDTAMARVIPLVVEVSDDGKAFREVARRPDVFVDWEPHFAPQHARYVRLRVDRQSMLHLEVVKVHP